jgi:hypothetical protein
VLVSGVGSAELGCIGAVFVVVVCMGGVLGCIGAVFAESILYIIIIYFL